MKKRRRAYKKYNWQGHSLDLIGKMLDHKIKEFFSDAMLIAMIFGNDCLAYDLDNEETFKAGLWTFTVPLPKPYVREEDESDKQG
ncbi:MAG: hypothetical protein IKG37_04395 [Solobacterium sp.]|nr:hypothetical protein [Solobacterium sp.]